MTGRALTATLLLALVLAMVPFGAEAKNPLIPTKKAAYVPGETLEFNAYVFGVYSGAANISLSEETTWKGKQVFKLSAKIKSAGMFSNAYPVNNEAWTYIDAKSLEPYRYVMNNDENGIKSEFLLNFDSKKGNLDGLKVKAGKKRKKVVKGVPYTLDLLSAMLFARNRDLSKGKQYTFYGHTGSFLYKVTLSCKGKEDTYTEFGVQETYKVEASITRWNYKKKKPTKKQWVRKLHLWFSTDEHHLPLKFAVKMFVGHVEVRLASFSGYSDLTVKDLESKSVGKDASKSKPAPTKEAPAPTKVEPAPTTPAKEEKPDPAPPAEGTTTTPPSTTPTSSPYL